ncbi:uncharacterized protein LOC131671673 [Phymastichus coffea]|uniref:uncharacterized protein LOC131671673 n=1 Tax=Phymastichus coffea TaxID=108790 RepID=UPI00273BAA7A|nr:uncharacterized protein LOC131671673 [Phymastichus coffea]
MERNLLLFFDRPHEPVFVPRSEQKVCFEVPISYLTDEYQPVAQRILTRFGNEAQSSIPIKPIAIPDLRIPLTLSRQEPFSLFIPRHRKCAAQMTELFIGMRTVDDLISLAAYCHDRVNPQMYIYALSVAILHRSDTKHLPIPQLSEIFPDKFVDSSVFSRAQTEANVVPTGSRNPIEIPLEWTATDVDEEHRVAYFREDIGINLHHWHWHLIYPFDGPMVAVNKDRRGELFYYMHHQIMARYNTERLCNGLAPAAPLDNLRAQIPEAYFPKMDQNVAGRAYASRPPNMFLSDVKRQVDDLTVTLNQMESWKNSIIDAISRRSVRMANGTVRQLDEETGIDILGNIMEASILSPDQNRYGELHNMGHVVLSFIHDPDHRYLESFSPVGDPSTAMRDPVFYRWHEFVDEVFALFKDSLPPYSIQQLNFAGVTIQDIHINTPNYNPNVLRCHWSKSDIDLSRGLDFAPRGSVLVRVQHLDHEAFTYSFLINNSNTKEVMATVRIFMAPKFDQSGRQLSQNEQRMLMIEMDKFTTRLRKGQNGITRSSTQSSITIPFEASFRNVDQNRPENNDLQNFDAFNFCGCGWPQHMLVPKGNTDGFAMDLFVMVSDYQQDRINQPDPIGCRDGVSFCGLRDRKYPDARAMGFPFDRRANPGINAMVDFLTPNMKLQQVTIRFSDNIKPRKSGNSQLSASNKMDKNLLLLFDRPHEPVFVPKGQKKVSFNIPTNYLLERYQPVAQRILSRFGNDALSSIPIKQIAIPDLSVPLSLGRREAFSLFLPRHRKCATRLTELFLGMRTVEDLLSLAAYCRDRVNPQMFIYALSVAILHRPDTKHLSIPQNSEIFPDKYFDSEIFSRAKEEANVVPNGSRTPIEIPLNWTATDIDPEHRVAYFREDVGINLHHWHWHLVYPFEGPRVAVNKDRRGELFYYMHHQIVCRYNIERLCNNLGRMRRLTNFRDPIPEAYFPKLDQTVAGRSYPARPTNMVLSDVNRQVDELRFALTDLDQFRERILTAIRTRTIRNANGSQTQLDENTGIDILGNMIEASILSPDRNFYGDFHNYGHLAISYAHDPDHRFLETFAVMGDSTTAMRDPVFYAWHSYIDYLFTLFKDSLPAYTQQQLDFPGVTVQDIRINTPGVNPNTLNCHWSKSDVDLSRGLDFAPPGAVLARIQHLDHESFSYSFVVNNSNNQEVMGTVRVFIAPKFDENGGPLGQNDQRMLMAEMDKFVVRLRRGQNVLTRNSVQSAITIPFEATFRNLEQNRPNASDIQNSDAFNICGCGWPQHMLVPKGTSSGFPMDLFVMISDYRLDRIEQAEAAGCRDGVSFCGLRDRRYPDARAMGFPFDRIARRGVNTMQTFLTPNMRLQQVTVRFSNVIKPRQSGRPQIG